MQSRPLALFFWQPFILCPVEGFCLFLSGSRVSVYYKSQNLSWGKHHTLHQESGLAVHSLAEDQGQVYFAQDSPSLILALLLSFLSLNQTEYILSLESSLLILFVVLNAM